MLDPHHIVNAIPVMAWILDPQGRLAFVNRQWLEYAGRTSDEALADPQGTMHPDDLAAAIGEWRERFVAGESYAGEMRLRGADGNYRWFLVRTVPERDGEGRIVRWYGTSTDIEDRKRAHEVIRADAQRLQALTRRLVELQESDRRELSRELHDRVGQVLTALLINMDIIRRHAAAQDEGEIRARVDDSLGLIDSAFKAVKDVMYELRPPMLDDQGLVAPLRWYARKFAERSGIRVKVAARDGWRCDPNVELALFRIAQEALANVARHAKATEVRIEISTTTGEVELRVKDDGVGISQARPDANAGYGLITMRERAESVGGTFEVRRRRSGTGTGLTVVIPADCAGSKT